MSRLTRNQDNFWGKDNYKGEKYVIGSDGVTSKQMCLNKLGNLEDLEEQAGCPLEVREQAFNNGFYDAEGNHYFCEHYVPYLKEMHTRGIMSHTEKHFKLKDYKKTWFLRKDKRD